ncbi:MAG: apolipoprotein N-acyltransferase [Lentisphaeria bacterium]
MHSNNENLAGLLRPGRRLAQAGLAVVSGVLLCLAFPPVEGSLLAWVALVPLLLVPVPAPVAVRAGLGYLFGLAFFLPNLFWLNTIGFGAGGWLALCCACYPMLWYLLAAALIRALAGCRPGGPPPRFWELTPARQLVAMLLLAAAWAGLEWVRGWLFTGFSWNQLGICQWSCQRLLPLAAWTGVYGLSFLVVAVNLALAGSWPRLAQRLARRPGAGTDSLHWPLLVLALLFIGVFFLDRALPRLGSPDTVLRTGAVQGCLPLCRSWTQKQLDDALATYTRLTREVAAGPLKPDLVVWPETAVPAPARWDAQYAGELKKLFPEIQLPLLAGTLDLQPRNGPDGRPAEPLMFNSALLFTADGRVAARYNKIHLVPYGEYVPFSRHLPWLVEFIGMGRDLTAGREYTIFRLPREVRAGVMICYEDAFGNLARQFTRRGADLLITLTNDAWYAESAGARQHLLHALFRAVENQRPLLRSGNNSDTCLILPDGRVTDLIRDPDTGYRFIPAANLYEIPIWHDAPLTFYARHGDLFAGACAAAAAATALVLWGRELRRRLRRLDAVAPAAVPEVGG